MQNHALFSAIGACAIITAAHAGTIGLTGDLGVLNLPTPPSIFINTTHTEPFFRVVPGRGRIQGDVVYTNLNGDFFKVVVTNMTFEANAPTPGGGTTRVQIDIVQGFQPAVANGSYYAEHFVGGNWSTNFGNAIFCDSFQGVLGPNPVWLPTLGVVNTPGIPSFGVPLAGANVTNSSPTLYGIATTIEMFIDGDGFINLPNSYEATATEVPAPGACVLLACAGVLASRRRRAAVTG